MKLYLKILIIIAFIIGLIGYNLWSILGSKVFYVSIASEFVILYFILWNIIKDKYWKLITQSIFITTLNSLVDELFFDPTKISINEYIGFLIIILTTFLFYGKYIKKKSNL